MSQLLTYNCLTFSSVLTPENPFLAVYVFYDNSCNKIQPFKITKITSKDGLDNYPLISFFDNNNLFYPNSTTYFDQWGSSFDAPRIYGYSCKTPTDTCKYNFYSTGGRYVMQYSMTTDEGTPVPHYVDIIIDSYKCQFLPSHEPTRSMEPTVLPTGISIQPINIDTSSAPNGIFNSGLSWEVVLGIGISFCAFNVLLLLFLTYICVTKVPFFLREYEMNEIDDERDSFVPLVDYIKWTRNDKEKNNKESLNFTGDKSMIITPPNYFGMTGVMGDSSRHSVRNALHREIFEDSNSHSETGRRNDGRLTLRSEQSNSTRNNPSIFSNPDQLVFRDSVTFRKSRNNDVGYYSEGLDQFGTLIGADVNFEGRRLYRESLSDSMTIDEYSIVEPQTHLNSRSDVENAEMKEIDTSNNETLPVNPLEVWSNKNTFIPSGEDHEFQSRREATSDSEVSMESLYQNSTARINGRISELF